MPLPTTILTAPPLPPDAPEPEPILIEPVVPVFEVPELNDSKPLIPVCPPLDVAIVIAPLDVAIP